jgi:hypothetical protein
MDSINSNAINVLSERLDQLTKQLNDFITRYENHTHVYVKPAPPCGCIEKAHTEKPN